MRMHRFIGEFELATGPLSVRDAGLRNQLKNVLRVAPGEKVVLCDGRGSEAVGAVRDYGASTVEFQIERVEKNGAESKVRVILFCAILKRENFELAVQKATEAGVAAIIPVVTRRTVKFGLREDRLVKIAKEAAEQSGRGVVPEIRVRMPLAAAIDLASANRRNVFFEVGGPAFDPREFIDERSGEVGVFVGPEGGWDPEEIAAARGGGLTIATLGPRTLRAETAAAVATYMLASLGDA